MSRVLFVDSSVVASLIVRESARDRIVRKEMDASSEVVASEIVVVEAEAALASFYAAAKNPEEAANALQNLNRVLVGISAYGVDSTVLGRARSLVRQYRVSFGLRSMDAIHVATASLLHSRYAARTSMRFEYLTADRRQHAAFTAEGLIGKCLQ